VDRASQTRAADNAVRRERNERALERVKKVLDDAKIRFYTETSENVGTFAVHIRLDEVN
jgi:hypothetical protein